MSIQFSWSPPPDDDQNGIIIHYIFTCRSEGQVVSEMFPMSYPAAGRYNISGFRPTITYNCSVYAVTLGGRGPSAVQVIIMPNDGTYVGFPSHACMSLSSTRFSIGYGEVIVIVQSYKVYRIKTAPHPPLDSQVCAAKKYKSVTSYPLISPETFVTSY